MSKDSNATADYTTDFTTETQRHREERSSFSPLRSRRSRSFFCYFFSVLSVRNIEVHDPDAADGAAHVKVVTIPTQTGGEGGKLVPVVSPGKDQQEEANLQEIGRAHV